MEIIPNKGIDTIQIYTPNFISNQKIMAQNHFVFSKYLNAENILKEKIYNNIRYGEETKNTYQVEIKDNQLFIKMSIPKYLNGSDDNTRVADKSNLEEFTDTLKKDLLKNGIDTDVNIMNISRLDITNNATMDNLTYYYIDMLKNINIPYIKEDGKKTYTTCNIWKNGSKAICIYDKIFEQKKEMSNILRNEIRIFKNKNIQKIYNISNIEDLKNNFSAVSKKSKDFEEKLLFYRDYEEIERIEKDKIDDMFESVVNMFNAKGIIKKSVMEEFLKFYGFKNLFARLENIEDIIEIIINKITFKDYNNKKIYKYRLKNQLLKMQENYEIYIKPSDKIIKYIDLYNECKEKLLIAI